jgi:CDP-diacylglycerol pyrophosphatase
MQSDNDYLERMVNGLEKLKKAQGNTQKKAQLKTLRVPSMNIVALWIKYPGNNNDQFYLTRGINQPETVLSEKEFFSLLRTLKTKVEKQDDTMGV